jgi:SHAQKYF class myb-like DNA-binding protein
MSTSTTDILPSTAPSPPTTTSVRITIPTSSTRLLDPSIVTPASDPDIYDYDIEEEESPEDGGDPDEFNSKLCGDKEKVGRWSDHEHRVFLDGLNHYGKQWKTIATMIGTRTVVQVRTHAQKYFQKMERSSGSSDESVTRSPKKVAPRAAAQPKRKSLPSVMPTRKKVRKARQLSMMGTRDTSTAVELEAKAAEM